MTSSAGSGIFLGGCASVLYSWRYIEFGPRLMLGRFDCGPPETALNITPLSVRYCFLF